MYINVSEFKYTIASLNTKDLVGVEPYDQLAACYCNCTYISTFLAHDLY